MIFTLPFLLFGTVWFWTILALAIVIEIALVENEKPFSAFALPASAAILFILFGDKHWGEWLLKHPIHDLLYILGYVVFGVAWSFGRWFFLLFLSQGKLKEVRAAYIKKKGEITAANRADYRAYLMNANAREPKLSENSGRIVFWMTYWPFSMVWTVIDKPFAWVFKALYYQFAGAYQAIADSMFKKYRSEYED